MRAPTGTPRPTQHTHKHTPNRHSTRERATPERRRQNSILNVPPLLMMVFDALSEWLKAVAHRLWLLVNDSLRCLAALRTFFPLSSMNLCLVQSVSVLTNRSVIFRSSCGDLMAPLYRFNESGSLSSIRGWLFAKNEARAGFNLRLDCLPFLTKGGHSAVLS